MPLSGSQTTRFGIRGIMERLTGSFAGKAFTEPSQAGELIIIDECTEIQEEEK